MKVYESDKIRNVVFAGHGGTGKTTLISGILYYTGMVNRFGKVEDGNAITDFDEDEISRKISIRPAIAYAEYKKHKINLLDTPGYMEFIQSAREPMRVADVAVILVDGISGVEVQTEKAWNFADEFNLPRAIIVNKLDKENADFEKTMESVHEFFGRSAVPVQIPIGKEHEFKGIIDLIRGKAYIYEEDESGKYKEEEIPGDLKDSFESKREEFIEMIAESDEDLMNKYFEEGTLSEEDILKGLKKALISNTIVPVFCAAASKNFGTAQLLDSIVEFFPSPLEGKEHKVINSKNEEEVEIKVDPEKPYLAYVFRTIADPFAGRITVFKVFRGKISSDTTIYNVNKKTNERLGSLQVLQGKNSTSISEVMAGDIAAVAKLKVTETGHTLADPSEPLMFPPLKYPEPAISFAIEPKSRGDEDKIGNALARLKEEDPMISFQRDPQTKELLLSGTGQLHVEVTVDRMKKRYGVEVNLKTPKVPYRETITAKADVMGKHKKQTGGHGQFGVCKIIMEPLERGKGFEFVDKIFGGAIPKQYIPAVEKGILEAAEKGYLAGYPVVDFKVTLYDGQYHEVDSSEMAFKIAASLAFKSAMEKAKPVLLEPIMKVEVYVPEENAGDIMGDLNSRRGRVLGMEAKGKMQIIKALVPLAEMLNYQPDLTSMTGGRGSFIMEFHGYEIVPHNIQEKIIEQAKKEKEEASK